MERRIPILNSEVYQQYFEELKDKEVFLLSNTESYKIWSQNIDKKADSFFRLPDNNWIVIADQRLIGKWIDEYNLDRYELIFDLLNKSFPSWAEGDTVWFCINKITVIETSWLCFKKQWINFISCEDDCPILINTNKSLCAIIFRPVGDFLKIGECG